MTILILFAFLLIALIATGLVAVLLPWNTAHLLPHPQPAKDYPEALSRIRAFQNRAPAGMNPVCSLKFMTHGEQVEHALVLVHGYTNCPAQFEELGKRFHQMGWNVLIAPMPHHGLADRMSEYHANLTAEEIVGYADEVVDIAQGLGRRVAMIGLSLGGVVTAWAAQFRSDLDLGLCISPALGFKSIPSALTVAVMNLYHYLPDEFNWWNSETKDALLPPVYGYPRYSKHALAQTLRVGCAVTLEAQNRKLAARKLIMVLNANDQAVNNEMARQLVEAWQAHGADVSTFEFEAALKLGHDLIDPTQPDQKIEVVYPRLMELAS